MTTKEAGEILKTCLNTELDTLWGMYQDGDIPEEMVTGDAIEDASTIYERLFDFETNSFESAMFEVGYIYGLKEAIKMIKDSDNEGR